MGASENLKTTQNPSQPPANVHIIGNLKKTSHNLKLISIDGDRDGEFGHRDGDLDHLGMVSLIIELMGLIISIW